jgi:hypothetical protein
LSFEFLVSAIGGLVIFSFGNATGLSSGDIFGGDCNVSAGGDGCAQPPAEHGAGDVVPDFRHMPSELRISPVGQGSGSFSTTQVPFGPLISPTEHGVVVGAETVVVVEVGVCLPGIGLAGVIVAVGFIVVGTGICVGPGIVGSVVVLVAVGAGVAAILPQANVITLPKPASAGIVALWP